MFTGSKLCDLLALDWPEFLGVRVCLRLWVGGEMVAEYEEEADREEVENPIWRYDAAVVDVPVCAVEIYAWPQNRICKKAK